MSDVLFKLKILFNTLWYAISEWKSQVWDKDLDDYYCCPGTNVYECGCGGATYRDIYEATYTKEPK